MEHQATAHHDEHPPTTIRQYVLIGLLLAAITGVELWLSYSPLARGLMISGLLGLSAVKFAIVVAFFMHLRFDNPFFTRMFLFGLVLAAALL
ncbi:MAG: cytochrome C oxidase subunit IV family protein, partial [Dehalococcoidia bacterium]